MADAAFNAIDHGSLRKLTEGDTNSHPTVQCVQIKALAPGVGGQERWRIVFNDTVNFIQGILATRKSSKRTFKRSV